MLKITRIKFLGGITLKANQKESPDKFELSSLSQPSPWPNVNARLLSLGVGLPTEPLDRLKSFSPLEFERFTLEWATDYLAKENGIYEVQQRGGAGDKGRDVIVWLDPPSVSKRRWRLYQCKRYANALGSGDAFEEIAKIIYYTFIKHYSAPEEYWFVTHKGVTGPLQDFLDEPEKLKQEILKLWDDNLSTKITNKVKILLDTDLIEHINSFDFSIFRAKQPQQLIDEHKKTRFHLAVFGLPLVERPPPPSPPSTVASSETGYVSQLFEVVSEKLGFPVTTATQFQNDKFMSSLFDRSRITFYYAENLKELARDQMADASYFSNLLGEFSNGLYYNYTMPSATGLHRLTETVKGAQSLQLGGHPLAPHVTAHDREGICHHMANEGIVKWCSND